MHEPTAPAYARALHGGSRLGCLTKSQAARADDRFDEGKRVSALLQSPRAMRAPATCSRTAPARAWRIRSWPRSPRGSLQRGDRTLRFQFPYMERGSKRPDPPQVAHAAVRAAVAEAARRLPGLAAVRRRKILRRTHELAGAGRAPLPGVRGLVFLGFPLHPAGKPSRRTRRAPRSTCRCRCCSCRARAMTLAELPAARARGRPPRCARDARRWFADADHSFHVPARSGRKDAEVMAELLDRLARWVAAR